MNAGTFIARKRRWELIAEADAAWNYHDRDALLGAMFLLIAAVLLAVWLT